jgi:UDP-glucose 4-epimerase
LNPGRGLLLNLGTGRGHSVRQVVDVCRRVSGREIPVRLAPRRPGDPAELVADASLARRVLDWQPRYPELEQIVETAWRWHSAHPQGFAAPR